MHCHIRVDKYGTEGGVAYRGQLEGEMGLRALMGGCATYQGAWGTSGNGAACMANATGGLGQKAHRWQLQEGGLPMAIARAGSCATNQGTYAAH